MNRRKRRIGIALLLLLLLIVPPVWITYREYRQARLDHALIEAIYAGNDQKALEVLAEGASGEAKDTGKAPTFTEALQQILNHLRHSATLPPPGKQTEHLPALILLYHLTIDDDKRHDRWGRSGPDLSLIRSLLDHGARVNDQDDDGCSPLLYAVLFPNCDTVRLFLERGANIEAANNSGETPLMGPLPEVTEMLLEQGAKIDAVDEAGYTALMQAAGRGDLDMVRVLLKHGAKVGVKALSGETALDLAGDNFGYTSDPEERKHFRQIAALLRKYGAK